MFSCKRTDDLFDKVDAIFFTGDTWNNQMTTEPMKCRKCGGNMKPSKAIEQTFTGRPDFIGDTYPVTMSPGGSGKLIDCLKCEDCGWSVTLTEERP